MEIYARNFICTELFSEFLPRDKHATPFTFARNQHPRVPANNHVFIRVMRMAETFLLRVLKIVWRVCIHVRAHLSAERRIVHGYCSGEIPGGACVGRG